MLVFAPFRFDNASERLWKGERLLALRKKPFAILRYLVAHPKQLVTHDELLEHVWRGAVVSDSAMRSHLHDLRQVLGEGVIETVIGRGYRFVAELSEDVAERSAPETAPVDPLVVGRDPEIELLRGALERARAGRRQICFVTGEPGIGKSTLVRTFLASLDPRSLIIGRGSCFEQHGTAEPYLAIIEALSALAHSARREQTLATLIRHAPTFVAQLPHLLSDEQLVEVSRRAAGSNEARQLRELSEALEALCSQDPFVLVLEDLQWSDLATIDLLSLLGQRQQGAKLLVICTSRHSEIQSPDHPLNRVLRSLVARSGALAIQVPKMGVAVVQTFMDRRFAGHAFPALLTELIAKITGGTPLFMVSLLDELVGRGMLVEQEGRWILAVSIEEVQAHRTTSVKQLIDLQLDRLSATEQRVLEAASIVGAEFSTNLAAAALDLPAEQVDDTCDSLLRRSLFLRAEPDDRYGFTHALVQEVCIERSSPLRRRRWHVRVAEALERDQHTGDSAHLLAKHFDAAGHPARAVPSYLAAARQAALRHATSDTIALCARALDLLPDLPANRERDLLEFQILGTMCGQVSSNSFKATFAGREPMAVYARLIEIARSLGDAPSVYTAITQLCSYQMIIAEYAQTAEWTLELERIEQVHALEPGLLQRGIFARAYIAFFRADLATSLRLLESLSAPEHAPSVFGTVALGHLACARWVAGDSERALDEALATIRLAETLDLPILLALGCVVRARLRYLRRDPLPLVEAEMEATVRAAAVDLGLHTEARAFALWARAQRTPLALTDIQPLLDDLRQRLREVSTGSTLVAQVLIDVLTISGHSAEARLLTDEILTFARTHDESVYLPALLRMRGEQLEATDPALATRDYHDAIELARSSGAHSLERLAASRAAVQLPPREPGTIHERRR